MKTSTQGAFKRPTTSLEETEPTRWRTVWNGRTILQKCEPNTCGIVQRAHTPVGKAALSPLGGKKKRQVVRRLLCMNNSRSFEDGLDEGPRERLLVGDSPRQRLQGRPFMGRGLLLLARPTAIAAAAVK